MAISYIIIILSYSENKRVRDIDTHGQTIIEMAEENLQKRSLRVNLRLLFLFRVDFEVWS